MLLRVYANVNSQPLAMGVRIFNSISLDMPMACIGNLGACKANPFESRGPGSHFAVFASY
jgi:hypothetical protein